MLLTVLALGFVLASIIKPFWMVLLVTGFWTTYTHPVWTLLFAIVALVVVLLMKHKFK